MDTENTLPAQPLTPMGDETIDINDAEKEQLFSDLIERLEPMHLALIHDDISKKAERMLLRENIALLIEEICMKDPKNGPKACSDFIDELIGIIRDAGSEVSTYKTVAAVEYKMKLKVKPLYIERMQRLNRNPEIIEWNKAQFEKDKKKFMTTQGASLVGIGDSDLPLWFKAIEARRRYTELVVRAVDDPEAEELRQSFHHRAQDELRGTQD